MAVAGRVTAVDETGRVRELHTGDPLYADEMLVAALGAIASVHLSNGGVFAVAAGTVAVLDSDVYDHDGATDDGSLRLTDVQHVLRWLQPTAHRSVA